MPDADFLQTLVRLASAGTSGICILAVFWCGFLLFRLPNDASRDRHRSLRYFMLMCLGIAVLSAATTFGAGYWDFKKVQALKSENTQLAVNLDRSQQTNSTLASTLNHEIHQKLVMSNQVVQLAEQLQSAAQRETLLTAQLGDIPKLREQFAAAQASIASERRNAKATIANLQTENGKLAQSLATLEKQFQETQKAITSSGGDREFLLKELKRLQTENDELRRLQPTPKIKIQRTTP